tara:strand:+ start:398 stop:517 length:120 start_codon:yes stop_codon:yes gene_type:complete
VALGFKIFVINPIEKAFIFLGILLDVAIEFIDIFFDSDL